MNNKFTIVSINNSQVYANEYGVCNHSTSILFNKEFELVLYFKFDGKVSWDLDKHYKNKKGICYKGIGENKVVNLNQMMINS